MYMQLPCSKKSDLLLWEMTQETPFKCQDSNMIIQEYLMGPLDYKPALQVGIELARN